jgi:hypothetical protein
MVVKMNQVTPAHLEYVVREETRVLGPGPGRPEVPSNLRLVWIAKTPVFQDLPLVAGVVRAAPSPANLTPH